MKGEKFRAELISAESEASHFARHRRLTRFPQLTMPLLAAYTPPHWEGFIAVKLFENLGDVGFNPETVELGPEEVRKVKR